MTDSPSTPAVWTIGKLLHWSCDYFKRNNLEDARLSAEVLLAYVTGLRRIDVYARFEQAPADDVLSKYRDLVRRAAAHEPIAYLVGEKEFYSLPFKVTRDVLIPRPETETLVEAVVDHCNTNALSQPRILDLGTGSGCLAISILKQLPQATAIATDVSPAALEIARENAQRHNLLERIDFLQADRLKLEGVPSHSIDVLVSNPPYVPVATWPTLKQNVREYEPRLAVTDDADGLTFYRMMASDAGRFLAPKGAVFVEIGDDCLAAVKDAFCGAGQWRFGGARRDRCTGRERVMIFASA